MTIIDLINMPEELEPETVHRFFPLLSSLDVQQIQALRILKYTRAAYEDMNVFENVVSVLNGISPTVNIMEGSTPEFIWKALDIIFKLHPNLELSWEIEHYIKYIFNDNGIYFYHPKISLENPIYDSVIERSKCGPFPLEEDHIGIQAYHYLRIQQYITEEG